MGLISASRWVAGSGAVVGLSNGPQVSTFALMKDDNPYQLPGLEHSSRALRHGGLLAPLFFCLGGFWTIVSTAVFGVRLYALLVPKHSYFAPPPRILFANAILLVAGLLGLAAAREFWKGRIARGAVYAVLFAVLFVGVVYLG
jgi:hypothetical protein